MQSENQRHPHDAVDSGNEERRRVAREFASRLRARGVHLTGRETDHELVELLEAVERFERIVEQRGGDLMVDEPVDSEPAREPDDRRFVLPRRGDGEAIDAYLIRIAEAADRATI